MKKFFITSWLTVMCFLLLGNVYAWEVPSYIRINSGARMWFSVLEGSLLQPNRVKLDLNDNVGIKKEKIAWDFFTYIRFSNIHVLRFRFEPLTTYDSRNDSFQKISNFRAGYDLDFFMTPQILFGANVDVNTTTFDTDVRDVLVGGNLYNYHESETKTTPLIGLHGSFYPILNDISIRPNISARVNWWNYENYETWDWETSAAVDVPINRWWTWTVNGGYRYWHTKFKRQFYDQRGKGPFVVIRNDFSKFFEKTRSILAETKPWDEIDFDRAVRSVCSQSYPKESLWNSLDGRELRNSVVDEGVNAIPVYKGNVPDELKEFYGYSLDQGHSIRIIPSFLEQDALIGNPEDFLYPAPVKTVLRCGLRWLKGYPVAPIPFIPGVGLAVPPEDKEI